MTVTHLIERLNMVEDKNVEVKFDITINGSMNIYFGYSGLVDEIYEHPDNVVLESHVGEVEYF